MKTKKFKSRLAVFFVGIIGLVLTAGISFMICHNESEERHNTAQSIAHSRSIMFQEFLDKRLNMTKTMKAVVFNTNGDISNIMPTLSELYRYNSPAVSSFELAPDGVVTTSYPVDENTIGTDLFASEKYKDQFVFSRDTMNFMLTLTPEDHPDTVTLYNPVYLKEKKTGYDIFWGFASTSFPFQTLLDESRISELTKNGYHYRLEMYYTGNHESTIIAQSDKDWNDSRAESYTVEETSYKFTLTLSPVNGWFSYQTAVWSCIAGIILTILAMSLTVASLRIKESNALLQELSSRDDLTKLLNRRSFETAIELLNKHKMSYTIFFLDANHFKAVNDTYGHDAGDEVLREYAIRLNDIFDGHVYRLGGDEFGGYVRHIMMDEEREKFLHKIQESMKKPFNYKGHEITLSISAGWSLSASGKSYEVMLKEADYMMYQRKEQYHDHGTCEIM